MGLGQASLAKTDGGPERERRRMSQVNEAKALVSNVARKVSRRLRVPNDDVHQLQAELTKTSLELQSVRDELDKAKRDLASVEPVGTPAVTPVKAPLPDSVKEVITRARSEKLTFLREKNLQQLASIVSGLDAAKIEGMVIEAGAARGGSAIVLAAAKSKSRDMKVYDVFGQIPEPSEKDGQDVHTRYKIIADGQAKGVGGDIYYGYRENLLDEVTESFSRLGYAVDANNVELIKGLFQDTMTIYGPVAFAHLDGDWYDSTMTCLERIAPNLSAGGRMVMDDYYGWSGCRDAVGDYFANRSGFHFEQHEKVHIVRH